MMRKAGIITGMIFGVLALIVLIYEAGYTHRYRYRLTVEVEVDGQIKSGSRVIEVISRPDLVPGRPLRYMTTFRGEAVYVDLGQRGNLFALLSAPDGFGAAFLPDKVFFRYPVSASPEEQKSRFAEFKRLAQRRTLRELQISQLPILVTFKDPNDPKSVTEVFPNDFAATFGPRVRLKRATLEMTDEPVATGIENILPWVSSMKTYLDRQSISRTRNPANRLSSADFKSNL